MGKKRKEKKKKKKEKKKIQPANIGEKKHSFYEIKKKRC